MGRLYHDAGSGGGNGSDAGPALAGLPQVCTAEGWCWTHPLPTSDRFVQAFAVGADDVWLIGASGTILRFAGGVWSTVPSPTSALSAIWASGPSDVWVGGTAGPYHWDGGAWSEAASPTSMQQRNVNAIWGCASDDVWMVGTVAVRWNGSQLSYPTQPILPGEFRAIWGSACDDVWAGVRIDASGAGRMLRWDGTSWIEIAGQPAEQIAGTGPNDIWSLAHGQLFHWTAPGAGTLHDSQTVNLFSVGADAVGTLGDRQVISVFAGNGAMSSPVPAPAPEAVSALWGRAADDIWGLGALGVATHWNGTAWTGALPMWAFNQGKAVKITGSGPTDLWAVAGATLLRGDGATWRTALTPEEVGGVILDVWARAPDDVWVLGGDDVIHRWDGGKWLSEDPPPRGTGTPEMRAISGTGPDDVWILRGNNSVLHWDGNVWISRQPLIESALDIWAAGDGEAWVVGHDGVSYWRNGSWYRPRLPISIGQTPFTAVAGNGPTDIWMLAGGYLLKVSDDRLEVLTVLDNSPRAGVALAPVATGGVWALFGDGTGVSRLQLVTSTDPNSIGRAVLAPAGLNDVWRAADGTLWAAGEGGALLRRRPAP